MPNKVPLPEPDYKELLSECCDAPSYFDVLWDDTLGIWIGMCRNCKEHASFYDTGKEDI